MINCFIFVIFIYLCVYLLTLEALDDRNNENEIQYSRNRRSTLVELIQLCQNSPEPGTFGSAEDEDNDLLTDILFNAPVYGKRMSSSLMEQQRRTKMYLQKV